MAGLAGLCAAQAGSPRSRQPDTSEARARGCCRYRRTGGVAGPAGLCAATAGSPRSRQPDTSVTLRLMAMRREDLRVSAAEFFAYDPPSSFCFEPGRVRHPSRPRWCNCRWCAPPERHALEARSRRRACCRTRCRAHVRARVAACREAARQGPAPVGRARGTRRAGRKEAAARARASLHRSRGHWLLPSLPREPGVCTCKCCTDDPALAESRPYVRG